MNAPMTVAQAHHKVASLGDQRIAPRCKNGRDVLFRTGRRKGDGSRQEIVIKFSIDPILAEALVLRFAEQLQQLDPSAEATMDKLFSGGHSRDYYEGLLAGYAVAHEVIQQSSTGGRTGNELPQIVAFVASKLKAQRAQTMH